MAVLDKMPVFVMLMFHCNLLHHSDFSDSGFNYMAFGILISQVTSLYCFCIRLFYQNCNDIAKHGIFQLCIFVYVRLSMCKLYNLACIVQNVRPVLESHALRVIVAICVNMNILRFITAINHDMLIYDISITVMLLLI